MCPALSLFIALVIIAIPVHGACAQDGSLAPEAGCTQIRASVQSLAKAERDEALALHLMADGKPNAMVSARFAALQERIADLREVLRRVRNGSSPNDQYVSECIDLGFRSLSEAESLSTQIEDIGMSEGGPLGVPPQLKPDAPRGAKKLPEPPLPGGPIREE